MRRPGGRGRIAAAAALLACAGCGFKGPLYLPERNATVVTHPAQPTQGQPPTGQTPPAQAPSPGTTKGKAKPSPTPPQVPPPPPPAA